MFESLPDPLHLSSSATTDIFDPHALYTRSVYIPLPQQILLKRATVVASLCVLIYDYLCTLDREVAYVWSRPRTLGTYLFVLNRYLPFVDLSLSLSALQAVLTPQGCHRQYTIITCLNMIGITISQTILTLRTIAIWGRNRWVLAILGTVYVSTLAISLVASKLFLASLEFLPTIPGFFASCVLIRANLFIIVNWGAVLVSETTIVILTVIRATKHLRSSNSSWVHQLYKRGFLFYLYLLALTTLNMIFPLFAPLTIRTNFTDPQRALHSMFCNRVIFIILSLQHEQAELQSFAGIGTYSRGFVESYDDGRVLSTMLDTFVTREERYPRNSSP